MLRANNKKCKECDNCTDCVILSYWEEMDEERKNDLKIMFKLTEEKIKELQTCEYFSKIFEHDINELCNDDKKCYFKSSEVVCKLNSETGKINHSDYLKIPCHCKMQEKFENKVIYDFGEPFDIIDGETWKKLLKRHEKEAKDSEFISKKQITVDLLDNIIHELKNGELVEMERPILNITIPTIIKFDKPTLQMKLDGKEYILEAKRLKLHSFEQINEYFKDKPLYYYQCWIEKKVFGCGINMFDFSPKKTIDKDDNITIVTKTESVDLSKDYKIPVLIDNENFEYARAKDLVVGDKVKTHNGIKEVRYIINHDKPNWFIVLRYFDLNGEENEI